ncbi:MAG: hypothetical protein LBD97_09010, partial [Bifidobacteriaceae bacterium]|nr:hypothetical protein [Bifidobacteriaceae bacterium]
MSGQDESPWTPEAENSPPPFAWQAILEAMTNSLGSQRPPSPSACAAAATGWPAEVGSAAPELRTAAAHDADPAVRAPASGAGVAAPGPDGARLGAAGSAAPGPGGIGLDDASPAAAPSDEAAEMWRNAVLGRFARSLAGEGRAAATVRAYRRDAADLLSRLLVGSNQDLDAVTLDDLRA